jgi:hypothetical protein
MIELIELRVERTLLYGGSEIETFPTCARTVSETWPPDRTPGESAIFAFLATATGTDAKARNWKCGSFTEEPRYWRHG